MSDARTRVIGLGRRTLTAAANRSRIARLTFARVSAELQHALPDDTYGGAYFGEGRSPLGRMGLSGYNRYDRFMSNADVAAYLVWRFLPGRHTLDAGCALGFVVEALRELDVDAEGVDVSFYAVDHATAGARGHVRQGSLLDRLPFDDATFDVVTALETLEHLPPDAIPTAIRELRRVCRGYLLATIPSFGPNANGPGGWYNGKVRDHRLAHYQRASRHLRRSGSVRRPRSRHRREPDRRPPHDRVVRLVDEAVRGRGLRTLRRDRAAHPPPPRALRSHEVLESLRPAGSGYHRDPRRRALGGRDRSVGATLESRHPSQRSRRLQGRRSGAESVTSCSGGWTPGAGVAYMWEWIVTGCSRGCRQRNSRRESPVWRLR